MKTPKQIGNRLYDLSMSVVEIIPICWQNLDVQVSENFADFLNEKGEIVATTLGYQEGSEAYEIICSSHSPADRHDDLINLDVNGFLAILEGQMFRPKGPGHWSSTCASIQKYVYSPKIEELPAAVLTAAEKLRELTHPRFEAQENNNES
ncbi:MAG: hypothetical protein AAFY78_24965 [Cyanobacteria bacterium J06648_16]